MEFRLRAAKKMGSEYIKSATIINAFFDFASFKKSCCKLMLKDWLHWKLLNLE